MLYPNPVKIDFKEDYTILVRFDSGEEKIYDAKPLIKGDWFGKLHDKKYFTSAYISENVIQWPEGQDIAPDELYYSSVNV